MGEAFITRRGSGKAFAWIAVEFPEGSTCTCTDGSKTLEAKTTGGSWVFNIPYAGTWTLTATDGSSTDSRSVSITTQWQTEKIELLFELLLLDGGDEKTSVTGGWTARKQGSYGGVTNTGSGLAQTASSGNATNAVTVDKIDTTGYSKLKMTVTNNVSGLNYACYLGLTNEVNFFDNTKLTASVSIPSGQTGTFEADISSHPGSFYVGTYLRGSDSPSITFSKVWLE